MKKLIPVILTALLFTFYAYPSYSSLVTQYQIKAGDQRVIPIAVWISCNGVPVALITSTSFGMLAGDIVQLKKAEYLQEGTDSNDLLHGAMDEALDNNALANIDLGQRDWFECNVK